MPYTVKKLADVSGVSVRTLHFYDEIGILKPAYYTENGYRHYEEEQILTLQQILFFRELGMELKKIHSILNQSDFERLKALRSHEKFLLKEVDRKQKLIKTIQKTICRLKGESKMKDQELFSGFNPEKQEEYEEYLKNQLDDLPAFAEAKENVKNWKKSDWSDAAQGWDTICADLSQALEKQLAPASKEVQRITANHYKWLKQFWTPNRESYTGLGLNYTSFEWKKAFQNHDTQHPKLAEFLAKAMKVFAERELT